MSAPFTGLAVLEYADLIAGPYCARLLADQGARVLKVEAPGRGDPARDWGPFPGDVPDREKSGLFLFLGMNKQSITLDPATPTGRNLFVHLASRADLLVEDTRPGAMRDLGLDYDALKKANPRLIYLSITPYGQDGPRAQWKAAHINSFHASGEGYTLPGGLTHSIFPGRAPVAGGAHLGEYDAGLLAASAAVAALLAREASGKGQHVDVSKQEATLAMNRLNQALYSGQGRELDRSRTYEYGGIYRCQDGYVILYPREDNQWQALAEIMGRPELAEDDRFRTRVDRIQHGEELNRAILEWAGTLTKHEIYGQVAPSGCPAAYFATAQDLAASPQLRARGFFEEVTHPKAGPIGYPSRSYQFSRAAESPPGAAPLLGQHNKEIFCGELGLERRELPGLRRAGVI